ncbi:Eukaryotic translation initiation factor 3 subunit E [Vitis vinifera]|uniref:Eukaryotic translation initiation factor 3 subunit E n=2 Tax=Vitis vinifera TaxID=29760 RepID=A0A438JLA7_VITVI|nr:Eukaryotic translation initiation factor 3 subunit E [Vitis vinifera]
MPSKDPITEFLACVYVNYDFDGAQKKMRECEEVILNDPFLGKRVEEGSFSTVPLRDEFLENARLFIFETYCRIHQRIDMGIASCGSANSKDPTFGLGEVVKHLVVINKVFQYFKCDVVVAFGESYFYCSRDANMHILSSVVLSDKLNLNYEEAERWIVNLITTSKLDAKIDSKSGTVVMEPNHPNVYQQIIDHTKAVSGRTYKLVNQLLEKAQTQAAR